MSAFGIRQLSGNDMKTPKVGTAKMGAALEVGTDTRSFDGAAACSRAARRTGSRRYDRSGGRGYAVDDQEVRIANLVKLVGPP